MRERLKKWGAGAFLVVALQSRIKNQTEWDSEALFSGCFLWVVPVLFLLKSRPQNTVGYQQNEV